MKNSTKSKHSTGSDTATKKINRWFRVAASHGNDLDHIFDLYWGGKERRISGLTLRIIGVNVIAVISLIIGVIYLGQYHSTLIEAKIKRFETEIALVSAAISEGLSSEDNEEAILMPKAQDLAARLGATLNKRILIFDNNDNMIVDSKILIEKNNIKPIFTISGEEEETTLNSIQLLKSTASLIVSLLPNNSSLPLFLEIGSKDANDYPDIIDAKQNNLSMSAWHDKEGKIILTAAMPVSNQSKIYGFVMLISDKEGIKKDLEEAWYSILKIFLVTLFITIFLSIYLSGVIAQPLRRLSSAAENVRKGKLKYSDIPDMSDRNDEIGELSIVLREMTRALWNRMDTIESFAADVSHEIKNPLTSLKSAVETAIIVKSKSDRDKLLTVIKHDIDRLDRLITDISNASRLDAELSRESFKIIDIKQTLKNLLDAYKNPLDRNIDNKEDNDQALKDGVMITLDLPDYADITVLGSEVRLAQVFQNIISNALSFAPKKTKIQIKAKIKYRQVVISIEDEGKGIPDNQLKNIFERFYSERPEHEKFGSHSGLGLSICEQIITAHNGIIYAENKKDKNGKTYGARFIIVLNMEQNL